VRLKGIKIMERFKQWSWEDEEENECRVCGETKLDEFYCSNCEEED